MASSSSSGWARGAGASGCWRRRSTRWQQRLDVVGQRLAYNLLWLAELRRRQPGRAAALQLAALSQVAAQRDLPDHRRRHPLGRAGPVPAFAQQPETAGFPHQRRFGTALEPLGRDPAGVVLRRLHGHAGAAGLRRRSPGRACRSRTSLGWSCSSSPWSPCGGDPRLSKASEERRSRAFNVTLGVSVLFAAFWALWFFGMMKAFWLAAGGGGPAGGHQRGRSVGGPRSHAARKRARPRGRPACVAAALERGARAFLIIGAISLLAWGWGVDLDTLSARRDDLDPGSARASSTRSSSCSWPISPGTSSER